MDIFGKIDCLHKRKAFMVALGFLLSAFSFDCHILNSVLLSECLSPDKMNHIQFHRKISTEDIVYLIYNIFLYKNKI